MSELGEWLEPRLANAPASLRERILGVLEAGNLPPGAAPRSPLPVSPSPLRAARCTSPPPPAPRSPLSDQLRQMAETLLESVKKAGYGAVALDLLAADALITYACEALSEVNPESLAEIA